MGYLSFIMIAKGTAKVILTLCILALIPPKLALPPVPLVAKESPTGLPLPALSTQEENKLPNPFMAFPITERHTVINLRDDKYFPASCRSIERSKCMIQLIPLPNHKLVLQITHLNLRTKRNYSTPSGVMCNDYLQIKVPSQGKHSPRSLSQEPICGQLISRDPNYDEPFIGLSVHFFDVNQNVQVTFVHGENTGDDGFHGKTGSDQSWTNKQILNYFQSNKKSDDHRQTYSVKKGISLNELGGEILVGSYEAQIPAPTGGKFWWRHRLQTTTVQSYVGKFQPPIRLLNIDSWKGINLTVYTVGKKDAKEDVEIKDFVYTPTTPDYNSGLYIKPTVFIIIAILKMIIAIAFYVKWADRKKREERNYASVGQVPN